MKRESSRSSRYHALVKAIDRTSRYSVEDALSLIQPNANARFDESVDVAVHLNIKKNDSVRGIVSLPHSFGKKRRILVFAKGEQVRHAEEAGAVHVGGTELITKIKNGWLEFDVAVATPEMMREVATLGAILGRRGLMPNPKSGTVTMDVARAVEELARGRREFRADKGGTVHAVIGKVSMKLEELRDNCITLIDTIYDHKPSDHKGKEYVNSIFLSSTMGVSLAVDISTVERY